MAAGRGERITWVGDVVHPHLVNYPSWSEIAVTTESCDRSKCQFRNSRPTKCRKARKGTKNVVTRSNRKTPSESSLKASLRNCSKNNAFKLLTVGSLLFFFFYGGIEQNEVKWWPFYEENEPFSLAPRGNYTRKRKKKSRLSKQNSAHFRPFHIRPTQIPKAPRKRPWSSGLCEAFFRKFWKEIT